MAPARLIQNDDLSTRPFVDYFWIAGLDSQELLEAYRAQTSSLETPIHNASLERINNLPLREDVLAEEDESFSSPGSSVPEQRKRPDSYHRLSKLSDEARRSIQSIDTIAKLHSNRSSATVRAVHTPSANTPNTRMSSALTEADFENALSKFASDRDTFFLNVDFRTDTSTPSPVKPKLKTQRIIAEELDGTPNRSIGSVRRHMSFRDMSSVKRQPSTAARRTSTRASKRISTYNAVVPQPDSIQSTSNEHPLRRTFEPVLLDRFPRPEMTEQIRRRNPFPDYVPMFAFPNDVQIISADSRPPTTWHEFSMTAADNSKIPAVCVVVWTPMSRLAADELEKLCEEWRRANLTGAEREMAASLGERLAIERAKLSVLLSRLSQVSQESTEREQLEDEISSVEEKINLMFDMLRPLRHGASNRIEGLTDGDTGLWIPRAYGILGRDESMTSVWKEWLKAVVVPMMNGGVLRIPASSPRIGMWQPLERYVFNICCEAQLPASSKIQIELSVRELRLYAKKEAANELPGSRNTDLYPLFRALTIPNIVVAFEYMLAEARIILVSSHVAMLKSASTALVQLLWPFEWAGVYIPVLPARLMQVLEAPCPYICGVHRKGDRLNLPDDDYVLIDLDKNEIHATEQPPPAPKQQRRKLMSLLHLAAPHHHSRGVPVGPPLSATTAFPNNAFSSGQEALFSAAVVPTNLAKLAGLSSSMFGQQAAADLGRPYILNAFMHFNPNAKSFDRPTTSSTTRQPSRLGSDSASPLTSTFPPLPPTPVSRSDSGFALQSSLREKRSGHFDTFNTGSDTFSSIRRKASLPFVKHGPSASYASLAPMSEGRSLYAPSSYAQSTLAASTVMPGMTFQPARNTETQLWVEGHCLLLQSSANQSHCSLCEEKIDGNHYSCSSCRLVVHPQCGAQIPIVCQAAFYSDQVRAAFARFFASLLYSYKKYIGPADSVQKKLGMSHKIDVEAWIRSLTPEHAAYIEMLKQTQAFNEFIAEREYTTSATSNSAKLFDAVLMAKRSRSGRMRPSMGSLGLGRIPFGRSHGGATTDFMTDTTSHVWRLVSFGIGSDRPDLSRAARGRDYHEIITRTPAKLEDGFLEKEKSTRKERTPTNGSAKLAQLKHRMNGLSMNAP